MNSLNCFHFWSRKDPSCFSSLIYLFSIRLVLDFDLLVYAFGQFPLVVCTWICMFLSALLVPYTLFHLWSQTQPGSYSHPRLYSLLFGSVFLLYQALGLGFLPTYVVVTNSLPPASCFIIILEQVDDQYLTFSLFSGTASTVSELYYAIFLASCKALLNTIWNVL